MNRGLFYQRSVMSLVPRLFGALLCIGERARAGGDARALQLTQAIFGRLQQTLVARDEMYWALNRPQNRDVAFKALTAFDLALLTLMGAVNASARLAHRLLGLDEAKEYDAGWQRDGWRQKVGEVSEAGVAAVEKENRLDALKGTREAAQYDPRGTSRSHRGFAGAGPGRYEDRVACGWC